MNVLSSEDNIIFQKIAVRLILILFVTVIFLGDSLCFWGTSSSSVVHSQSFYGSDLQISSDKNYRASVKEVQLKLWQISLARRYGSTLKKNVKDGVVHIRMTKYFNNRPLRINVIEFNPYLNPDIKIVPLMAGDKLAKKASVVNMSQKNNAVAAVNGSFFKPQTGVPLGIMMIDKKLLTGPIYDRVALGITDNGFKMDRVSLNASLSYLGNTLKVNNINQPRTLCTDVLIYTADWGKVSPKTAKYGIQIAVQDGKIIEMSENPLNVPQKNGYVISAPRSKIDEFLSVEKERKILKRKENKEILLDVKTNPDWEDVNHIISGGPFLVKDGNVFVDYVEEKFKPITGKNPRTAVGYTKEGYFIMVTIDGREQNSVGAGLFELAKIMKSFDCVYAMNLDGGGSSTMQINGRIVNSPSVRGGINVSNSLALVQTDKLSLAE
ncbi:MAG: phosphodiester glycosidase family protein [Candidatus Gastranaerophilales bacterium]|nr:phosphodiester glycosidase family protein [Candidatus Gastranaerophilales bacterium]